MLSPLTRLALVAVAGLAGDGGRDCAHAGGGGGSARAPRDQRGNAGDAADQPSVRHTHAPSVHYAHLTLTIGEWNPQVLRGSDETPSCAVCGAAPEPGGGQGPAECGRGAAAPRGAPNAAAREEGGEP
eukprot:1860909-Pyramimonas_sp.AAC.1